MTDEEIREKIFDIIAKEARIDRGTLTLETKLEDLKIESLDMVRSCSASRTRSTSTFRRTTRASSSRRSRTWSTA